MNNYSNFVLSGPFSFTPAGTIGAGQPVGYDGALCADDNPLFGINGYDVALADNTQLSPTGGGTGMAMRHGIFELTAGGAINVGDPIKVASGKFIAGAVDTSANAAKNVGWAVTAATGSGSKFMAYIP